MKCRKHPKYKGIHRPKIGCADCRDWWLTCQAARDKEIKNCNYDDGYGTYEGGPAPLD